MVIAIIAGQRFEEERDVLPEGIKLVLKRSPRAEQIAANLAAHIEHKGGLRLMIGVIGRQKIGEQPPILVNRIDRISQKTSLTTKLADRIPVSFAISPNGKCPFCVHRSVWPR